MPWGPLPMQNACRLSYKSSFDKIQDQGYLSMFTKPSWRKRVLLAMFIQFACMSFGASLPLKVPNFRLTSHPGERNCELYSDHLRVAWAVWSYATSALRYSYPRHILRLDTDFELGVYAIIGFLGVFATALIVDKLGRRTCFCKSSLSLKTEVSTKSRSD